MLKYGSSVSLSYVSYGSVDLYHCVLPCTVPGGTGQWGTRKMTESNRHAKHERLIKRDKKQVTGNRDIES